MNSSAQKRLQNILDLTSDGICELDAQGVIVSANHRLIEMLGVSLSDVLGKHFYHFVDSEELQQSKSYIESVKAGADLAIRMHLINNNQEKLLCGFHVVIIRSDSGRISGFTAMIHFLQERAHSVGIEDSKLKLLQGLTAGLIHDINNRLAVVSGSSMTMGMLVRDEKFIKEKFEQGLSRIDNSIQRLAETIKVFRAFNVGLLSKDETVITLETLINQCMTLCESRFKNHGIEVIVGEFQKELLINTSGISAALTVVEGLLLAFESLSNEKAKWVEVLFNHEISSNEVVLTFKSSATNFKFNTTLKSQPAIEFKQAA